MFYGNYFTRITVHTYISKKTPYQNSSAQLFVHIWASQNHRMQGYGSSLITTMEVLSDYTDVKSKQMNEDSILVLFFFALWQLIKYHLWNQTL